MARIPMSIDGIGQNCLELELEDENVKGSSIADRAVLTINALLKPAAHFAEKLHAANARLFDLHGMLYVGNEYADPGAPLRAFRTDQPGIPNLGQIGFGLPLAFDLTRPYLHYLEEHRQKTATKPGADMVLKLKLWGLVTMTSPASNTTNTSALVPSL